MNNVENSVRSPVQQCHGSVSTSCSELGVNGRSDPGVVCMPCNVTLDHPIHVRLYTRKYLVTLPPYGRPDRIRFKVWATIFICPCVPIGSKAKLPALYAEGIYICTCQGVYTKVLLLYIYITRSTDTTGKHTLSCHTSRGYLDQAFCKVLEQRTAGSIMRGAKSHESLQLLVPVAIISLWACHVNLHQCTTAMGRPNWLSKCQHARLTVLHAELHHG